MAVQCKRLSSDKNIKCNTEFTKAQYPRTISAKGSLLIIISDAAEDLTEQANNK